MIAVHPSRLARRVRDHQGWPAHPTCSRSSSCSARRASPPRCASCRSSKRRATCAPARDVMNGLLSIPLVPRSRAAPLGAPGGDGRLLRFGEGDRPAARRVGALQGAGVDRGRVRRARRADHAVPRPRRQRRARRRTHAPGDSIAASRLGGRHAARHRAGRDDPGEVRPARHRASNAGGLHDGHARSDARAGGCGATALARDDGAALGRRARRVPADGLRRSAIPPLFQPRDARKPSSTPCTSAAGRRGAAGFGELQTLRAIPWQFAWTQTRLLLPSWLGVEELASAALSEEDREVCREMYRDWPFFRSTVDLIAMGLAKADAGIAEHYDRQLVPPEYRDLGQALRERLTRGDSRRPADDRPPGPARRQPRAAPFDRRPEPLRRSNQPRAGRAAAAAPAAVCGRSSPTTTRRRSGCAGRCSSPSTASPRG